MSRRYLVLCMVVLLVIGVFGIPLLRRSPFGTPIFSRLASISRSTLRPWPSSRMLRPTPRERWSFSFSPRVSWEMPIRS